MKLLVVLGCILTKPVDSALELLNFIIATWVKSHNKVVLLDLFSINAWQL